MVQALTPGLCSLEEYLKILLKSFLSLEVVKSLRPKGKVLLVLRYNLAR